MKTTSIILIATLLAAGFYFVLFPGESIQYWTTEGELNRLSFWVHENSFCAWRTERMTASGWIELESGYLEHYTYRDENLETPLLYCRLDDPQRLEASTARKITASFTFLPIVVR